MASVFNRGTRAIPRWYAQVKYADGRWKMHRVQANTAPEARQLMTKMQARLDAGLPPFEEFAPPSEKIGTLLARWAATLTNRSARDDRSRIKTLIPAWLKAMPIADVKLATVMRWLDELKARTHVVKEAQPDGTTIEKEVAKYADSTMRNGFNLLSRFFGWAIERGHVEINPTRMVSRRSRPKQSPSIARRWLDDDLIVRRLFETLPAPINVMFYIGNRCGLRLGELCGLRLSDLAEIHGAEPVLRVMVQYNGAPLKEDRPDRAKKVKWPPIAADAAALVHAQRVLRERAGAAPDDLLWPHPTLKDEQDKRLCYRREYVDACWLEAVAALKDDLPALVGLSFYEATRHSFVSRNRAAGVPLDVIADSVGHASTATTRAHYDHYVRKTYPAAMRASLSIGVEHGGKLIPLRGFTTPVLQQVDKSSPTENKAVGESDSDAVV